jgi:hypothetical protein
MEKEMIMIQHIISLKMETIKNKNQSYNVKTYRNYLFWNITWFFVYFVDEYFNLSLRSLLDFEFNNIQWFWYRSQIQNIENDYSKFIQDSKMVIRDFQQHLTSDRIAT